MPATFELAPDVERIARDIIATEIEHEHLRQARILYLFRRGTWVSRGKTVYGKAKKVTGELAFVAQQLLARQIGEQIEMGEPPAFTGSSRPLQYDFVLEINRDTWPNLTDLQRKAIIDHELCHCLIDTKGKTSITGHDVEDFGSVIRRYGLYMQDLKSFGKAVRQAPDQMTLDDITAQQIADGLTVPAGVDGITVEMHGQKAEVTRRAAAAAEDDAELALALGHFGFGAVAANAEGPAESLADEDEVAEGPLYHRYFCEKCKKRIRKDETEGLPGQPGEFIHEPMDGTNCGGPVFVALPGEPDPTFEAEADARAAS